MSLILGFEPPFYFCDKFLACKGFLACGGEVGGNGAGGDGFEGGGFEGGGKMDERRCTIKGAAF